MDLVPRRSLAIPRKMPPDAYRAYLEHPEVATLNQIMLHYLEIEEILKLYRQDHEQFETRQALGTLSKRFDLPAAVDFKQLLQYYDMKYATARSYLYGNRAPTEILIQLALEGNIQGLYNQLKLYPELRNQKVYSRVLDCAAQGGHEAIIELLFELGVEEVDRAVLLNAALGGHLELVLKELAKGVTDRYVEDAVRYSATRRHKHVVEALINYRITPEIFQDAMTGAGRSGDISTIEYAISKGGTDYKILIYNAAIHGHFEVVRKYWDKLDNPKTNFKGDVLQDAARHGDLDMVMFLVDGVEQSTVKYVLKYVKNECLRLIEEDKSVDNLYTAKHVAKRAAKHAAKIERLTTTIKYLESRVKVVSI